ncbi:hypothetical protein [Actinoplanes sp. NPDC049265]|uniref:hypothetical protein n=1 Tax=Actinoplanes sp. NPDC049265 TaxID=3363902 RepID=UPI003714A457
MGFDFPADAGGRRSSLAFGRAVVADALRTVDPAAAAAAEREPDWRKGYVRHFVKLTELASPEVAAAGLASVHRRFDRPDLDGGAAAAVETIVGSGTPEREVTLPYRGRLLRGSELGRQLDAWVSGSVIEQSCADAVREVAGNPEWLDVAGHTLVVLGAGAEMGPLAAWLGWGGTVVGVDLPRPDLWERVVAVAGKSAGRLLALRADLLAELPEVAGCLAEVPGPLVLGNYVYAPGATYPRLAVAVDALGEHLRRRRDDVTLAGLATPTDAFNVPAAAVAESRERWQRRSLRAKAGHRLGAGRVMAPNYPDGSPAVFDGLFPIQGPNYALAKRILRWRSALTSPVVFGVAPSTRTRSVTSNRLLAAAYAGAHLFDVEIFEPATASKLMAILLVHQLRKPHPFDEGYAAAHGGLWRAPFRPRTALPLAAVRGLFP